MKIYTVDSFTGEKFRGNPAGVCLLEQDMPDHWMQKVAAEMNLSETAFLLKDKDNFKLRWFTPQVEVDLCGHATLASAHILWEQNIWENKKIVFKTKSGDLFAQKENQWIKLNFPLDPPIPCTPPSLLSPALGVEFKDCAKSRFDYLIEVNQEKVLKNLSPNFEMLKQIDARGIMLTCLSENPEYHFVSRCFYPALGINEDPVTGSAHCSLGPYWANKLGKTELNAFQASSRGGQLKLNVLEKRIIISGQAITTMKGELIS